METQQRTLTGATLPEPTRKDELKVLAAVAGTVLAGTVIAAVTGHGIAGALYAFVPPVLVAAAIVEVLAQATATPIAVMMAVAAYTLYFAQLRKHARQNGARYLTWRRFLVNILVAALPWTAVAFALTVTVTDGGHFTYDSIAEHSGWMIPLAVLAVPLIISAFEPWRKLPLRKPRHQTQQ